MKLATYSHDGVTRLGVVDGDRVTALPQGAGWPADMTALIADWPALEPRVRDYLAGNPDSVSLPSVNLLAPIARPSKIMCIGLNYEDHLAETGMARPTDQLWFAKQPRSAAGPFDDVELPRMSQSTDWEVELVVVIGKGGRNLTHDQAASSIFGYAVGNDVSVRDMQLRTSQWLMGKAFDTHAPFGPWITTSDEVGDAEKLGIRCLVNGKTVQDSNTSNLIYKIADQIVTLSSIMTLDPGDLIFTGTPGGVGNSMTPPVFLKEGDLCRCEIDKLGHIENRFAAR